MTTEGEVIQAEVAPENPVSTVHTQSLQVRSKLGEQLYDLMRNDIATFYARIRDAALGDDKTLTPRQRSARSYMNREVQAWKMFLALMKMVNADIKVDRANVNTDFETFKEMLKETDTKQLKMLVKAMHGSDDD